MPQHLSKGTKLGEYSGLSHAIQCTRGPQQAVVMENPFVQIDLLQCCNVIAFLFWGERNMDRHDLATLNESFILFPMICNYINPQSQDYSFINACNLSI